MYVGYAAAAGDEDMIKIRDAYNHLPPRERNAMMPETLCDLAGVQTADLIAAVAKQVWLHKHPESSITVAMEQPLVIESTAEFAKASPDNYKHAELFMRLSGALPDKHGASIVINNSPQTANINHSPAGANGYKTMDQRIIEMGKLLDDPQSISLPLNEAANVFAEQDESED